MQLSCSSYQFAIKFNLNVPFTTHYGLVNAIPRKWKANLTNPIPNVTHDTTVNSLKTSSIYSSLLNAVFVPPTAETKILRHGFTESTIQKVYLMPFKVTNEVKIMMFQYKVYITCFQPALHFTQTAFQKDPYATYAIRKNTLLSQT